MIDLDKIALLDSKRDDFGKQQTVFVVNKIQSINVNATIA